MVNRVEANATQQGDFQFNATATDLPRVTLPKVICIDEDDVTHVDNVTGGTSFVNATFGLGITTIDCIADDLSNFGPNEPTTPDVDNSTTSRDFIVSEIFFDTLQNPTPLWDDEIATNGTVYGFLLGENVTVTYGIDPFEQVDTFVIDFSGQYDNFTAATDGGVVWNSNHAFSNVTSNSTQTIDVELVSNPNQANATSQNATIQRHPTIFFQTDTNSTNPDPLDFFWGDDITTSGILLDIAFLNNRLRLIVSAIWKQEQYPSITLGRNGKLIFYKLNALDRKLLASDFRFE